METNVKNQETAAQPIGQCSVPMWMNGCPAGLCGNPAYGERPPSRMLWNVFSCREYRKDGLYDGFVPGLACRIHGGPSALSGK